MAKACRIPSLVAGDRTSADAESGSGGIGLSQDPDRLAEIAAMRARVKAGLSPTTGAKPESMTGRFCRCGVELPDNDAAVFCVSCTREINNQKKRRLDQAQRPRSIRVGNRWLKLERPDARPCEKV